MKKERMIFRNRLLLLAVCCVLLSAFAACGRRGDPVLVEPRDERPAKEKTKDVQKEGKTSRGRAEQKKKEEVQPALIPDAPSGLTGLYTGESVILVWNEVAGKGITYRVYRSLDGDFSAAGESVTPAFTDRGIDAGKKYRYRVTAFGTAEGPPSNEITISTETQ